MALPFFVWGGEEGLKELKKLDTLELSSPARMDLKLGYLAVGANGLNLSFLPFCYLLPKGTLPPLPPHLQSSNSSLFINYARIDVKPQGRGWAAPREATVKFPTPGQIMNVKFQPPRVNSSESQTIEALCMFKISTQGKPCISISQG